MGVDCKTYVKPIAKIEDILKVMAILLGAGKIIENNNHNNRNYQTLNLAQNSLKVKVGSMGETDKNGYISNFDSFLSVLIISQFETKYNLFVHPQNNSKGEMLFSSRSTPVPAALSVKLIEIFGGKFFVYDDDKITKKVTTGLWQPFFTDDEDDGFIEKNKFLINLKPLTPNDIHTANKTCYYNYSTSEMEEIIDDFKKFQTIEFADKLEDTLENKKNKRRKKI